MAEYFSLVTFVLLYLIFLDIWIYFYRRYLRRKILKALTFIYNECFFGKKTVKRSIPRDEHVLGTVLDYVRELYLSKEFKRDMESVKGKSDTLTF